jgi:O-antigen/teichoic acid export membrane protein
MSGRLDRYLRHLASFVMGRVVSAGVQFFLTAILLRRLGSEAYGVWIIACSLGSSLGLVDMNTNASVVKYTAELQATGRRSELAPMVNAGVQILFTFSFGLFAVALLGLPWLTPLIFKTSAYTPFDLKVLSALCLLSFALMQMASVYTQVLQGLLRQDEVNAIGVMVIVVNALAVVFVVCRGMGVIWLGAANLVGTSAGLLATRWRVWRLVPELSWLSFRSTPKWRRTLLHFTAGSYAFTLWGWFYYTVPKLILANQLGPSWVAFFDIGAKLGYQGRNLVQTLSQYLIPFMSDSAAREGSSKVQAMQVKALTFIWMVGLGVGGFLFAVHTPLIQLWLHRSDPALLIAAALVLVEYTAGSLAMPWVHFALAEERLRHARPFLLFIIPYCVLGPVLGLMAGPLVQSGFPRAFALLHLPLTYANARFAGFLLGGVLANTAGTVLFYWLAVRERAMDGRALASKLGRVSVGCMAGLLVLGMIAWTPRPPALMAAGLLWVAVLGGVWAALGLYDSELAGRLLGKIGLGRAV